MLLYIMFVVFLPIIANFSPFFGFLILDHLYKILVERASSNHTDIYRMLGCHSWSTAVLMLHVSKQVYSPGSSMTVARFQISSVYVRHYWLLILYIQPFLVTSRDISHQGRRQGWKIYTFLNKTSVHYTVHNISCFHFSIYWIISP